MAESKTTIGLFTVGPSLTVSSWDDWMASATGRSPASVEGRSILELYPDLEERGLAARLRETVAEGKVHMLAPAFHGHFLPCPVSHASGALMRQRATIAPLRGAGGEVTGALVTIEDVTPRLEREKELADQLASPDEAVRVAAVRALTDSDSAALWTSALADRHWSVRRESVSRMAREGAAAVDALLSAMKNNHVDPGLLNSSLQVLVAFGIDVVAPLSACLSSTDADLRVYAALALGDQKDPRAVDALLGALQDENPNVRFHSIESLGRLKAARAAESLRAIAATGDFYLGFPALDALAEIGDAEAAPVAARLLSNELLRPSAVELLARVGGVSEAAALASNALTIGAVETAVALSAIHARLSGFKDSAVEAARAAATALPPEAIDALVNAAGSVSELETRAIARVLSWLSDGPWVARLSEALEDPAKRDALLPALVDLGRPGARVLEKLIGAEDEAVRRAAASGLGSVGDPASAPVLIEAMDDPALTVISAGAIARLGATTAFEPVFKFIGHPDGAVRQAAIGALNSMGHPDLERRVVPLLDSPDVRIRESAVKIAGYFGYPAAFERVAALTSDAEENVRRAAIETLAFFDDERVLPLISKAAERDDSASLTAAMRALAFVTEPGAIDLLIEGLRSPDAWTRYYAARSLGRHAAGDAVSALSKLLLGDSAGHVRAAAGEALGRIGDLPAVEALSTAVRSTDDEVARVAIEALGRIPGPKALSTLSQVVKRREDKRAALAVAVLGTRGDIDAIPLLLQTTESPDESLASAAIAALGDIAAPEAVDALLSLCSQSRHRAACVRALGGLGDALVIRLSRGLASGDVSVRTATVESLAGMKRPSASEAIASALRDPSAEVRLAAVAALARLGNREFRSEIADIARHDADPAVAAAAKRASQ